MCKIRIFRPLVSSIGDPTFNRLRDGCNVADPYDCPKLLLLFMSVSNGISTVLVLVCGLFSSLSLVIALLSRQIENIRSSNLLITAAVEVYAP